MADDKTSPLGAIVLLAVTLVAAAPPSPEFSANRFRAHVTFLADDLLEGREAGTRGHEIAARYIASQFALLGVKPAGTDGTYYEKADFVESALTGAPPPSRSKAVARRKPSVKATRRSSSGRWAAAPSMCERRSSSPAMA